MRAILLGAPGAGKGTQAKYLATHYNIPIISTGEMLRSAVQKETTFGLKVQKIMASGALVSNEIMINIVKERIQQEDCNSGYILDGFPRTIEQAEVLQSSGIAIDYVIEIFVPDTEIITRLTGRLVHPQSGRTYHLKYNPPKKPGLDDITHELLVQREDDKEATVHERLRVYHEKTAPLINYYQELEKNSIKSPRYVKIDGMGEMEEIEQRLFASLNASA